MPRIISSKIKGSKSWKSSTRFDIFTKLTIITILLLLVATPIITHNRFDLRQNAASMSSFTPVGMRSLSDPLYGVTVDDVTNVSNIVNSSKNLSHMPTTRIVFDEGVQPSYYVNSVNQIQPVSYIMGELLDSESLAVSTVQQYQDRTISYLTTLGDKVDIWEIGNEVNGNWTGSYDQVGSKIYAAYSAVKAAGKRSELTLWYNDQCGNGPSELDPIAFSQKYVPADMRMGLDYVLVSYYEKQCNNIRPTEAHLIDFFTQLHNLYPNARIGFGEIGFPNKVGSNTSAAESMINYYYGLNIPVPGYIGGYFWWYYYEDMLPSTSKPLWQIINNAFTNMPTYNSTQPTISPTTPIVPTTIPTTIIVRPTNTPIPTLQPTNIPTPTSVSTPTPISFPLLGNAIGYTKIGPKVDKGNSNTIDGSPITTPNSPVRVLSMSVYVDRIDSAPYNQYQVAIYTNNNGRPGNLIAKSNTSRLIGNTWNSVDLSTYLEANTSYWIMYNTNGRKDTLNNLHYIDLPVKQAYYTASNFGTWPASLNGGSRWTGKFSMYISIQ